MTATLIGKEVNCSTMPKDSNYKVVSGKVVEVRNGYAIIQLTGFQTIFDDTWYQGNGFQQTSALVENCVIDQ